MGSPLAQCPLGIPRPPTLGRWFVGEVCQLQVALRGYRALSPPLANAPSTIMSHQPLLLLNDADEHLHKTAMYDQLDAKDSDSRMIQQWNLSDNLQSSECVLNRCGLV
ncbi:Hypothetical predicted protein [Pelobates cultripes]|uniref:Uncharacterized protein n=1 Tax=Pelobates cultripes TaxID=61616 RepID=A0AAD1R550_PELCU|nr:Hypothetical predicted protein [Pelobates cultripes]